MINKLTQVKTRIQLAAKSANRNPDEITLLAVGKKHSAEKIRELHALGVVHFGENYLQEALDKIKVCANFEAIQWHFIGPIQSNKTRAIAEHFQWVHSIDRQKIADRLHQFRPENVSPLNVCLQINIDKEETKSGTMPEDALTLAREVSKLQNLSLRGLMCIPSRNTDAFTRMQELFNEIEQQLHLPHWDTLSMGMSGDLEEAVYAGSTIVRVGTALFGER